MPAVRSSLILLGCLVLSLPEASAEEYRLQVANLHRDSFAHFIDGPIRTGSGELAMSNLERALEHPPKPATFKAAIGWERRPSGDRSSFEGWRP